MNRMAPDGTAKRRAKGGEERCGGCRFYFGRYKTERYAGLDMDGEWTWFGGEQQPSRCYAPRVVGIHAGFGEVYEYERPCRADDRACSMIERRGA